MYIQDKKTRLMTESALIAAVYVALVLLFKPISFGAIQFRIAEALCILPFFSLSAVPGLALGCLLGDAGCAVRYIGDTFGGNPEL